MGSCFSFFAEPKENMETPEFPPNSEASKRQPEEEKDIHRVTSSDAVRRKKPLRKQFSAGTFVRGSSRMAAQYVVFDVLIPAARDMLADGARGYIDKLIYGNTARRGSSPPLSGPTGYVSYNRYSPSRPTSPQRALSREARARHDFDEILLESRGEAEEVIDRMFEVISRYGTASIADLYALVGIASSHVDNKWGWENLRGAGVTRTRGGYLLDLPEPEPIAQ